MQVLLTRASVAMGDDVDAPHARRVDLPPGATVRDVCQWVLGHHYVASVVGGSTWAVRVRVGAGGRSGAHAGGQGAAVAVLTQRPTSLLFAGDPFLRLTEGAHVHLDYLLHQDAEATLALIRRDPARANLRLG